MKSIIIFLLVIIASLIGYNTYSNYQRLHPDNYEYVADTQINAQHPNKTLALDYYQAIEKLNGHIITQHTVNGIDVRNPEDDDKTTLTAVAKHNELLGTVRFYESRLKAPIEEIVIKTDEEIRNEFIEKLSISNTQVLTLGNKAALIFELQRLLNKQGEAIEVDGVFSNETINALKSFESKKRLLVDGKLDAMTLGYLLQ